MTDLETSSAGYNARLFYGVQTCYLVLDSARIES